MFLILRHRSVPIVIPWSGVVIFIPGTILFGFFIFLLGLLLVGHYRAPTGDLAARDIKRRG
jgi:hypothetical protein